MPNNDIRNWLSPQRHHASQQPIHQVPARPRRRRILESDESDDNQPLQHADAVEHAAPPMLQPAIAPQQQPPLAAPVHRVVLLESSESDDMYVPLPPERQLPARQDQSAPRHNDHEELQDGAHGVGRRNPRHARNRRRRRFEDEAEESSDADDDDSSDCIESDTNAQRQYRDAIMGVRNARNARVQMRSATAPCQVCALFASFIQHFL